MQPTIDGVIEGGRSSWLTADIGPDHVHHLGSRIPFNRLPEVRRGHPELRDVGHITFRESMRCIPLVLWDEGSRRFVSSRTARSGATVRPST